MDTTKTINREAELKAALDTLETSIATPIVAGDLDNWIGTLQHAWTEAAAQIHFHAKHLHPRQYDEIASQDPKLLPRIELLKAEDAAIEEQRAKLNECVSRVTQHVPQLEPDEAKAKKHIQLLVDNVMAFITRTRKQGVAIQTWYMEAFNRDCGAVD